MPVQQGLFPSRSKVHRPDDRGPGQLPARVADLLAPVQAACRIAQVGRRSGEGSQLRNRPVGPDPDQPGSVFQTGLDRIDVVSDGRRAPVGGVAPGIRRQRRIRDEGAAPPGVVGLPDRLEPVRNLGKCLVERQRGHLPYRVGHIEERDGQLACKDIVVVSLQEQRFVPARAQARGQQVAGPVMVRRVVFQRAVAPAVEVPPVAFVECDPHIFQEIGGPSPAERCQAGLGHDGVPFGECDAGVEGPPGDVGQVADQPAQAPERPFPPELELGGVPGFVGDEIEQPGHRIRVGGVPDRVEVHPPRRPHHHAVAVGGERVQDDVHRRAAEG